MMQEQEDFITNILSAASEKRAIRKPSQKIQNNLTSLLNQIQLSKWSKEFKDFLFSANKKMEWFVQLMVLKRASFLPSHSDSYLKFLEEAASQPLYEEVILTTCESCKVLLFSTAREPSEESFLTVVKSLGNWFGKVTIARNRQLLDTDLDLKSLIREAFVKGLMTIIIPFIAEVLEPCRNNRTYQLPNSWVMDILNLLCEIYAMPGLQISLLSSIEGLFEIFGVIGPVHPTSLLAALSKKEDDNPDFIDNEPSTTRKAHDQHLSTGIDKIKDTVVINTRLHPQLSCHSNSLRLLQLAVYQAIETVVPDLVKMSVNVALQTTKAHVLMAYPLGTSDLLRNDAAHMIVTPLAQRYAKKMCKEPLRGWMYSLLHGSLQQSRIRYATRCTIVDSIIRCNLNRICGGIQEMAKTEVVRDIEAHVRSWIYPSNDEKSIDSKKEYLKPGISVSEMKDLLDSHYGFVGEKYEALLEAIFSGVEKGFAKVLEEKKSYLAAIMEPMSEGSLLHAIENYFNKRVSVSCKEELPTVFECLLTAPSVVDKDDLVVFLEKMKNEREASTSIWQSVKNMLDRLEGGIVQDRVPWII